MNYIEMIKVGGRLEALEEMKRVQKAYDRQAAYSCHFENRILDLVHARMGLSPWATLDSIENKMLLEAKRDALTNSFEDMLEENFRLRELNLDLERKLEFATMPLCIG